MFARVRIRHGITVRSWGARVGRAGLVCVAWILCVAVAVAEEVEGRETEIPDPAALEAAGAVFGEIVLERSNVFDLDKKEENRLLFRWANKLHVLTRPAVIRRQLLFKTGDPYSERLTEESERILRESVSIYDAEIRPIRYEDGRVDVEVRTRDTWTLQGGVGFGRSGGKSSYRIRLQDENFLGTGKDVLLLHTVNVDRTSLLYRYKDPALFGTRNRLLLLYSDNDDGFQKGFGLERPFYALDTRWSAGGSATITEQEDSLYTRGEIRDVFGEDSKNLDAFVAFSNGLHERRVLRYGFGFTYEQALFRAVPDTIGALPEDRTLAYPYLRLQWLDDRFREMHNLDRIGPTEDVNFGREASLQLGWSAPGLGADRERMIVRGTYRASRNPTPRQIVLWSADAEGRLTAEPENVMVETAGRYFLRGVARGTFHTELSLAYAHRLDAERQLLLGGDNGLRGYPLRYAEGDRRYLLTLEQRWYTSWYPLRLAHVGAAVFFDVGEAWFAEDGRSAGSGTLTDVGFGLRVFPSRASTETVAHLDVAFPLGGDDTIDRVQFLITSRDRF